MLWIMWNHCLSINNDKKDLDKVEVILGFKITRSKRELFLWNSQSWEDLMEMLLFEWKLATCKHILWSKCKNTWDGVKQTEYVSIIDTP